MVTRVIGTNVVCGPPDGPRWGDYEEAEIVSGKYVRLRKAT
jgi:hypothetical protein